MNNKLFTEQIINYIDIKALITALNINITNETDTHYQAHCINPEHDDSTPSWFINKKNGLWHCFGCGIKGNLISLIKYIKKIYDLDINKNIFSFLQDYTTIKFNSNDFQQIFATLNLKHRMDLFKKEQESFSLLHKIELPYFQKHDNESIYYLKNKGIQTDIIKNVFLFGICNDWRNQYHRYLNRLIIPVFNNTHPVFFQARDIFLSNVDKNIPKDLFPFGLKKTQFLFNFEKINKKLPVVLVESPLDVYLLYPYYKNIMAIFGSRLSNVQAQQIINNNIKKIIILPDPDSGFNPFLETTLQYLFNKTEIKVGRFNKKHPNLSLQILEPITVFLTKQKFFKMEKIDKQNKLKNKRGVYV